MKKVKKKKVDEEKEEMKEELEEAKAAINQLRSDLNEVNLLNSKLLYTNKIFRGKNLTENQKIKVLKAFDKAETVKQAKTIFETLNENLVAKTKKSNIRESLGAASKPAGVAPKRPVTENVIQEDAMVNRFPNNLQVLNNFNLILKKQKMSNLNSLESSNQWKSVQSDAAKLANKWNKTGLLEGIGNETEKNNMSLILENQAKQLVVESSQTGGGTAGASFSAGTGEQWAGIALPLVRKVFGQIAAKDFVSVQPMSLPSGLVFFLDFQYGGNGAFPTQGGKFTNGGDVFGAGSLYGKTDVNPVSDGLYGAGKWTYSSNTTQSAANGTSTSASWADVGYDSDLSASVSAGTLKKITIATSVFNEPDLEGVRGFFVSGANLTTNYPQYNKVAANGTDVELFVLGNPGVDATG